MSLHHEQIEYIKNYLYPYKFTNNKTIIVNFLTEIYANIYKRCNSIFDSYTFNEVINLPMIISDKIFNALTGKQKKLTLNDFSQGIYEIFFAPIEEKAQFVFKVFDFDDDKVIEKNDVFLILAHFHLIENTTFTIHYLEDLIEHFFGEKNRINEEEYFNILNKNADIFILMIIFMNNYTTLIKDSELREYKESINYEKFEENYNYYEHSDMYKNNSFNYQISETLLKYIHKVKLLDFDEYTYYESDDDSTDDLQDLNNFENDMKDCLQKLCKPIEILPKFYTMDNKKLDFNDKFLITLNPHETKIKNSGISVFSKAHAYKNNFDIYNDIDKRTNFNYSYREIYQNGNKKEIIVYKYKEGKKMDKKIKLVLVNYYIFFFKKCGNIYLFKKIIPIFSLFAKKQTIDNYIILTFSSTLHNFNKEYSFVCENEEDTDKFFNWFNKNIHHKDINKYFLFKCELGKGQFGQVLLAERIKDKKLFAIKIVLKTNPTEEEYKINRWESTIFNCLHNIKNKNVIKTIQRFESETKIFFVFEYIKGCDLYSYIRKNHDNPKIYNVSNLINITLQILKGVQCLHKYGIIHRDIKSTNIMVSQNNLYEDLDGTPNDSIKILDFGLSRILGKFEYSDEPYGSLCFKAPEMIKHMQYNFKVDIWAVGITLFYIIYGELPFDKGEKDDIKYSIMNDSITFYNNDIIKDFKYINDDDYANNGKITKSSFLYSIMRDCLEKNKDKRYSIEQLIEKYVKKFH